MGGVLLIDKPEQITSHDVVQQVRRLFETRKVGHAGTLDPFATGLLLVCLDEATRIVEYLVGCEKEYLGVMRLGETTDTQDYTGSIVATAPVAEETFQRLAQVCEQFIGEIAQIPPMYSARRVQGTRLYTLARQGQTVARQARQVMIHTLDILERSGRDVRFRVVCSTGTYVRTLAHDIGNALGCGAHLISLQRTRIGSFALDAAVTLDRMDCMTPEDKRSQIIPTDRALVFFPAIAIEHDAVSRLLHGTVIPLSAVLDQGRFQSEPDDRQIYRVYSPDGAFLALAKKKLVNKPENRHWRLQPLKVLGAI